MIFAKTDDVSITFIFHININNNDKINATRKFKKEHLVSPALKGWGLRCSKYFIISEDYCMQFM